MKPLNPTARQPRGAARALQQPKFAHRSAVISRRQSAQPNQPNPNPAAHSHLQPPDTSPPTQTGQRAQPAPAAAAAKGADKPLIASTTQQVVKSNEVLALPGADLDSPKFFDPTQPITRQRVARVSAIAFLYFAVCAGWVLWTKRPLAFPSPSSNIWIDLLTFALPHMYLLHFVHYLLLAICSAAAFVAVTVGHVDPPGNPLRREVRIWRRQTLRIAIPNWIYALALAIGALVAHRAGHAWLSVLLEAPATGFALYAAALRWIPTARKFVCCSMYPQFDGMANLVQIGGGTGAWRGKSIVLYPEDIVSVERRTTIWGYICNFSDMVFHTRHQGDVDVRGYGSHQLTEDSCAFFNSVFIRLARPVGNHPINFALQDGKQDDPSLALIRPPSRRVRLW
jgi:hypothetical protein